MRLRRDGTPISYIVSSNQNTNEGLVNQGRGGVRFESEGELGFVKATPDPDTMPLYRYVSPTEKEWRLGRDNQLSLAVQGFTKEVLVGYIPRG